jgi:hypothetical protein
MGSGASGEIASFTALVSHMRAAHTPVVDASGVERYLVENEGGHCPVGVAPVPAPPGRPWLSLSISIGDLAPLALRAILVANAELPVGALAVVGDAVVLRQTLPLDGLLVAQLDQALRALVTVSAQLRAAGGDGESPYRYVYR